MYHFLKPSKRLYNCNCVATVVSVMIYLVVCKLAYNCRINNLKKKLKIIVKRVKNKK